MSSTHRIVLPDGAEIWKNDKGEIHRDNGPAILKADGTQVWYDSHRIHRDDGPASIGPRGEFWYHFGRFHRVDGPAAMYAVGEHQWYLNGVRYIDLSDFAKAAMLTDEDRIIIRLKFGVDI